MKYCMLAINGLKKKKGDTVAMFILIAVATIMMYIGLSVFTNLMPVLDAVNNQNNGADVLIATQCQDVKGMEKQIKGWLLKHTSGLEERTAIMNFADCFTMKRSAKFFICGDLICILL